MANPITIPNNSYLIPVNLSSSFKTFTLPVVSTNPGRVIIFKDMFGNAANSTLRLSTIGLDRIERSNVSSMALSNTYGAWTFLNDGITNWFLTSAYLNSLPIIQPPSFSNFFWTTFYNCPNASSGSAPSINGPPNTGWGGTIGTASNYNPINYQDGDSRIGQSDNVGIVIKGFVFSSSNTTIQFRMVIDDGGVIFFNGVNVLQSWIYQGDTTYTSGSLTLNSGYTPFEMRFFEGGGGMTCELYYSIAGGAFASDGTGRFFHNASSKT